MRHHSIRTLLAALLFAGTAAGAQAASTSCPAHFLGGKAPDVEAKLSGKTKELCFSEFAVLHSGLTRTPLYSADHLTAARVAAAKQQRRSDAAESFHEENRLPPEDRARLADYVRSGYDRGHMSPNGDFDNEAAQGESFSMANMIPQNPDNNRNLWEGIEEATRTLAQKSGEVWVVTVPIFGGGQTRWLHDRVAIPAKIAKAVYVPSTGTASAYLVDNAPGMAWSSISIVQLKGLSGIDPFPALPDSVKQKAVQLPEPTIHGGKGPR